MKRLIPILLTCALALGLAGCGDFAPDPTQTPDAAAEFSKTARDNGFGVIIAAAGKAAHLAGVLAAHTTLPVIGIPVKSSTLDGLDALLATVQMPAILACQMLALSDEDLAAQLAQMKEDMAQGVAKKNAALQEKVAAL